MSILLFFLGSIIASFMYQITCYKQINLDVLKERSKCLTCYKILSAFDLIPIISFLVLKSRCRYCHNKIPIDLFLVEVLLSIFFVVPIIFSAVDPSTLYYFYVIFMIPLSIYDAIYFIVPNHVLFIMFVVQLFIIDNNFEMFISTCIISLILHIIYFCTKGGIGYGDIKLLSIVSISLTWQQFYFLFVCTFIVAGLFVALYKLLTRRTLKYIPLVPFIAISTFSTMVYAPLLKL